MWKRVYVVVLTMTMILGLLCPSEVYGNDITNFTGSGDGTSFDPYIISTVEELNQVRNNLSACYKLNNDIDMTIENWNPIGSEQQPFTGKFNGNGHIIKNLKINKEYDLDNFDENSIYLGLFGYISGAVVENLGVENVDYNVIVNDYNGGKMPFINIGGISGGVKKSIITQCYLTGSISSSAGKGIYVSNAVRERRYQEYVRGWVEYFRLADMKGLLKTTEEWSRRRIRAVYWKQWKKIKTRYRMLKALGIEHWKAKELACSRKGYWRMAQVLNSVITNKIIAKLGYISMLDYYLTVCEN